MKKNLLFSEIIRDTKIEVIVGNNIDKDGGYVIESVRKKGDEMRATNLLELALWYPTQFDNFITELRKEIK